MQEYEELRMKYLWVFQWINCACLVFAILLAIDFFLPSERTTEQIVDSWTTRMSRGIRSPLRIVTETGRKFFVSDNQIGAFWEVNADGRLVLDVSRIFHTVLRAGNAERMVGISIHYTGFVAIPFALLIFSLIGVLVGKRVNAVYNLGALNLILLLLTNFLLFI